VRSCVDRDLRQHTFWRLRWGRELGYHDRFFKP